MVRVVLILLGLFPLLVNSLNCITEKCNSYVYLSTQPDPVQEVKDLKVAIITAGGVRSFAFNEKSWRRYLLDPWNTSQVHVFAHLTSPHRHCVLYKMGIDAMTEIATEVEVSYAQAPLMTREEVQAHYGGIKSCVQHYNTGSQRFGNIIDMHARRRRVYEMAVHYAENKGFKWDLMMFVRSDSAFYSPKLEFYKIYKGFHNHTKVTGRKALIVPPGCSFGHICDRSVIGLPEDMAVYFNASMLSAIAAWSHEVNPADTELEINNKKDIRESTVCADERMVKVWLENINGYEITDSFPLAQSFITQRSITAPFYCNRTRQDFNNMAHPVLWDDKTTIWWTPVSDFDHVADPIARCGSIYKMNITEVCESPECRCGERGR